MARKLVKEAEYTYECDRSWCHNEVKGRGYRITLPIRYDYWMNWSPIHDRRYCSTYCAMAERDRLFPITGDNNGR